MTIIDEASSTVAGTPGEHAAQAADDAVRSIQDAFQGTRSAKEFGTPATRTQATARLQHAVDDARELGIGWERIGDSIGIARGNAYQRYRKRLA